MTDPYKIYSQTTELPPKKLVDQDADSGEIAEYDLNREQRHDALKRAHEIRKFEIELYWKRASYFWVLQAAVFAAIGLTWHAKELEIPLVIPVAFAALGLVTSVAGVLSAKGSKFWQENWEHHIDMLEDEFEGRLHKTAYVGKYGLAWSVSGVNERLAFCFTFFWTAIIIAAIDKANPWLKSRFPDCFTWMTSTGAQTLAVLAVMLVAVIVLVNRRTEFKDAKAVSYQSMPPTIEGFQVIAADKLPSVEDLAHSGKPFLIRREPKT